MKLKVIGSNSAGNGYIFISDKGESLILELGCKFNDYIKALGFNTSGVAAAIISHSHLDHSKYTNQALDAAINVYTSKETIKESGLKSHRLKPIEANKAYKFGGFKVYPFDVFHDVKNFGYIIHHEEMGNVLFATDTVYLKQRFANLNQILIEANYDNDIIERHGIDMTLRSRIIDTHMEFSTTKKILRANDLSKVQNIVMIHLSNGNSDKLDFIKQVKKATGKNNVFCATKGMNINFNLNSF